MVGLCSSGRPFNASVAVMISKRGSMCLHPIGKNIEDSGEMEDGHVRIDSGENGLLLALHLVGIAVGGGPDHSTGSRPCNSYQRDTVACLCILLIVAGGMSTFYSAPGQVTSYL
jgi:hypothetical protein